MIRQRTRAALLLLAAALAAGCSRPLRIDNSSGAPQQVSSEEKLVASGQPRVADVPMPMGFSMKESTSMAQMTGNVRYVSHYYTGRKGKDRVAAFYCDQMSANHGWRRECVRDNFGVWRMHFAKGHERCDVTVTDNFLGTTSIHIEIYAVPPAG